jgi:hypothetical protein
MKHVKEMKRPSIHSSVYPQVNCNRYQLEGMHTHLANKTPKTTIKNKIDPENWENHTVNLIEELDDEQIKNAVLLSYIEEEKSKVWINAKTGIAMKLAIKETKRRQIFTIS